MLMYSRQMPALNTLIFFLASALADGARASSAMIRLVPLENISDAVLFNQKIIQSYNVF